MRPAPGAGSAPASIPELLARFPEDSPPVGLAGAAVTIVLRQGREEVEVLLIERTERETDPASGQVGLPGGHVDPVDSSLGRTALRELREEVGLSETDLRGSLRFVEVLEASRFRMHVAIFAGELAGGGARPSVASRDEVAHVFWLPRSALSRTRKVARETPTGTLEVAATVHEGHVLWGFTRRVLRDFFALPPEDLLGGPAFAPRSPPPA